MPNDPPPNLIPLHTVGDGNCLPRAVSTSLFGNESKHREIQLHILMECLKNKQNYLDDVYLRYQATHIHKCGTFPQQYALFSGQYIHAGFGNVSDIVEIIYEKEIITLKNNGAFMGMWQLWALTNILGRPVRSIFLHCGGTEFRADFNQLLVPLNASLRKKSPLHIMWTPMYPHGDIIHFVPFLERN